MMHHDWHHYFWLIKTIGVGTASGISTALGVIVAQTPAATTTSTEGSTTAILAGAIAAALGSLIYLFQLDKKNAHELKIKEQETRQLELQNEAQKSDIAARDRKSREDTLMAMATKSLESLQECAAERRMLQERVTFLLERNEPIEANHESITDSSTRRKFVPPPDGKQKH